MLNMQIRNIFLVLILAIAVSGCSSVKKLDIFKTEVKRERLNLEKPTPPQLEEIKWIIITSENAEEVFKKLEEAGIDPVLFGLTDADYQLIAKNFAQIRNHMVKTNRLLDEYKKYYEPEDKEVDK